MLNNERDLTRFFVSAFCCESACWRVSHRRFSETSLFVFGAPLKWCLIPSARDSEIFCLTSFRISITLQRTGTGATRWNERSGFNKEIPLSYENLGSSRETNLKVRVGNVKLLPTFMKDGEHRKRAWPVFWRCKKCL